MRWPQGSKVRLSSSWVVSTAGPLCLGRQLKKKLSMCVTEKETLFMFMCAYMCACACARARTHDKVRVSGTKCATYKDPWGQCGSIHPVKCFSDLPPHPHSNTKGMNWSLLNLSHLLLWSEMLINKHSSISYYKLVWYSINTHLHSPIFPNNICTCPTSLPNFLWAFGLLQ